MIDNMISIIIPIYNGEERLKKCLDSILMQKYRNYEIILIDDGSVDKSGIIGLEYKKNNDNIKYFYQENQGVSAARNLGIKKAGGKYIYFMDCDDTLSSEMSLLFMMKIIKERDRELYIFNYNIENNNSIIRNNNSKESRDYTKNEFFKSLGYENEFGGYLWNKVFLKDIIFCNNICFNRNYKVLEDIDFVINYVEKINSIYYESEEVYNYYQNPNSVLHTKINKNTLTIIDAVDSFIDILESNKVDCSHYYYLYFFCYKIGKYLFVNDELFKKKEVIKNAKERYKKLLYSRIKILFKVKIIGINTFPRIIIFLKGYRRKR